MGNKKAKAVKPIEIEITDEMKKRLKQQWVKGVPHGFPKPK